MANKDFSHEQANRLVPDGPPHFLNTSPFNILLRSSLPPSTARPGIRYTSYIILKNIFWFVLRAGVNFRIRDLQELFL